MNKKELFAKYHINEGHKVWEPYIDNWFSVEIYRQTHDGELPPPDDTSAAWVLDFIEKTKDPKYFFSLENPGSHYTTAHRMIYRYADKILEEINQPSKAPQEGKQ